MSSHAIQPIPVVADYFGSTESPIVAEEFVSGRGWRRQTYRKRISASWARKLRRRGVSHVALELDGRRADFTVDELVKT